MELVLREDKGSELTHAELDGNFKYLKGENIELSSSGMGGPRLILSAEIADENIFSDIVRGRTYRLGKITLDGDMTYVTSPHDDIEHYEKIQTRFTIFVSPGEGGLSFSFSETVMTDRSDKIILGESFPFAWGMDLTVKPKWIPTFSDLGLTVNFSIGF